MITKKDYLLISIIGFLFGLLLLPILSNINIPFFTVNLKSAFLIVIVFTVFANLALWLVSLLSRFIPVLLQIAKFAAVGGLNTLLDLGVLNVLILISGIAAGYWYPVFKGISFVIANINSYFWNKHWTFGVSDSANIKEFSQFLTVSIIGFGINISAASLMVNIIGAPENISLERWANIGALSATMISLIWNFIGYKFFVFKK
ncbi:MAG: GtrA family protein [bacterium]|nr:GtrA family protein [bacterium]